MSDPKVVVTNSFPVLGLLGVVFIIMKILGYITWSWWLVLLPFYIGIAVVLAFLGGGLLFAGLLLAGAWMIDQYNAAKRKKERAKREAERVKAEEAKRTST